MVFFMGENNIPSRKRLGTEVEKLEEKAPLCAASPN